MSSHLLGSKQISLSRPAQVIRRNLMRLCAGVGEHHIRKSFEDHDLSAYTILEVRWSVEEWKIVGPCGIIVIHSGGCWTFRHNPLQSEFFLTYKWFAPHSSRRGWTMWSKISFISAWSILMRTALATMWNSRAWALLTPVGGQIRYLRHNCRNIQSPRRNVTTKIEADRLRQGPKYDWQ